MIVLGNLANITLFSAAIPGPEQYLAGHPLMVVTLILVQIVATLALIVCSQHERCRTSPLLEALQNLSLSRG